jgi:hypothetical protein
VDGIFNFRFSPTHIPNRPWSQPAKHQPPNMTFHFISIIFKSTDNFFTYLSKEYNIISVDSKYLQQARHTQDRKKSRYLWEFCREISKPTV